jgi:multiple sugar transport system permease protein
MLFLAVLGMLMVPGMVTFVPQFVLVSNMGLTNSYAGLILPFLVGPFGVFLMRQFLQSIPDDLIEAARVDGAGELHIFLTVAFRLLVPGSVTVLLFTLVATWNNYFLPLIMLNTPEKFPLTVGLAQWQSTASGGSGSQALFSTVITGSLVSIIPLIVAFLFLQRFWQTGLSSGGVKA